MINRVGIIASEQGFSNFSALKNYLGSPGTGNQWHHIVEQCQIVKSGFNPEQIQNIENVLSIDQNIHAQISGHYASILYYTEGLTVRNWLAGQSYEYQYNYGLQILNGYGIKY